ncbi:MAG: hypothetical protein AAFN59_04750 [Pseudomonadota bacterium]
MQRLVLAVLVCLVIVAIGAWALRSLIQTASSDTIEKSFEMDKLAYGLLLALIVYVSVTGGA